MMTQQTSPEPMNMVAASEGSSSGGKPGGDSSRDANISCLDKFSDAVNGTMERAFSKLGRFIARRPLVVIATSILVAIILSAGIIQLENETRGDKLWTPSGTEAEKDNEYVKTNYPRFARFSNFIISLENDDDILTPAAFDRAFAVHKTAIETVYTDDDGVAFGYPDICLSRQQTKGALEALGCTMVSVLALFGYDPALWATRQMILETLNTKSSWRQDLVGGDFLLNKYIGGYKTDEAGNAIGGTSLSFSYLGFQDPVLSDDQKADTVSDGWEQGWLDAMEAANAEDAYEVNFFATRSFDDEFGGTISNDVALLQIAILAIGTYTAIQLSRSSDNCVGSRVVLTLMGLLAIGFAIGSCYGFVSVLGVIYSPLMSILPFIMIGVGVDSMFVLVSAFDITDPESSIEDRLAYTLSSAGISVTLASFTNFGAFIIGSNTSLPALRAFSIYAAFGLLFDWMFQITFFAAMISLDGRRQLGRRFDVVCCAKSSAPKDQGFPCGACGPPNKKKLIERFMSLLGRGITMRPFQLGILMVGGLLLGAGAYGVSQMNVDADVNTFIPDGSYLKDFFDTSAADFDQAGPSIALYFADMPEGVDLDFSNPDTWEQMEGAIQIMEADAYVVDGSVDAWYASFKTFLAMDNKVLTQDTFFADLGTFLETPFGVRYNGDIKFYEEDNLSAGIKTTRFKATWRYLENSQEQVRAMNAIRESIKEIPAPLGTNSFAFGSDFLQFEQYKTIGSEALMNIGLGCAMVAFVIVLLLASPLASILTFCSVITVIIELVGFMYYWGFFVDSVTVIFLVISLGLSVDYSVHVAHGYLANQNSDPDLRIITTMENTGSAVINGAISTFLAALCLSGSGSYVFWTFFCALFLVVLFGMFQGLVVLPVLLRLCQPKAHYRRH